MNVDKKGNKAKEVTLGLPGILVVVKGKRKSKAIFTHPTRNEAHQPKLKQA